MTNRNVNYISEEHPVYCSILREINEKLQQTKLPKLFIKTWSLNVNGTNFNVFSVFSKIADNFFVNDAIPSNGIWKRSYQQYFHFSTLDFVLYRFTLTSAKLKYNPLCIHRVKLNMVSIKK